LTEREREREGRESESEPGERGGKKERWESGGSDVGHL